MAAARACAQAATLRAHRSVPSRSPISPLYLPSISPLSPLYLVRRRVAASLDESAELETMPFEWKWQPGGQQFGAGAGADRQLYFNTLSRLNVDQQPGGSIG